MPVRPIHMIQPLDTMQSSALYRNKTASQRYIKSGIAMAGTMSCVRHDQELYCALPQRIKNWPSAYLLRLTGLAPYEEYLIDK